MVKYIIILMVLWLILSICFSYMTYLIGYTKGFNKCKRINDEILDEHSKERVSMAGFVSKQPNGLYCRFSTVTDCPTAWNMTREDYINMKMQEAKEDAEDVLDNYLKPFDMVVDMYYPNNMTKKEFNEFLEETGYSKGE